MSGLHHLSQFIKTKPELAVKMSAQILDDDLMRKWQWCFRNELKAYSSSPFLQRQKHVRFNGVYIFQLFGGKYIHLRGLCTLGQRDEEVCVQLFQLVFFVYLYTMYFLVFGSFNLMSTFMSHWWPVDFMCTTSFLHIKKFTLSVLQLIEYDEMNI